MKSSVLRLVSLLIVMTLVLLPHATTAMAMDDTFVDDSVFYVEKKFSGRLYHFAIYRFAHSI